MNEYNGFSGAERMATVRLQDQAEMQGLLIRPAYCEMCRSTGSRLSWHLEDYRFPVKDARPLCPECHMRLHARFKKPSTWLHYLLGLREGNVGQYTTVGQFMAATRSQWSTPEPARPIFAPDPARWWENLSMMPVNVKGQAGQLYILKLQGGRMKCCQ